MNCRYLWGKKIQGKCSSIWSFISVSFLVWSFCLKNNFNISMNILQFRSFKDALELVLLRLLRKIVSFALLAFTFKMYMYRFSWSFDFVHSIGSDFFLCCERLMAIFRLTALFPSCVTRSNIVLHLMKYFLQEDEDQKAAHFILWTRKSMEKRRLPIKWNSLQTQCFPWNLISILIFATKPNH